jgi:hypothetical protein
MPIENNTVSWVRSANMQSEVVVSFAASQQRKRAFQLELGLEIGCRELR